MISVLKIHPKPYTLNRRKVGYLGFRYGLDIAFSGSGSGLKVQASGSFRVFYWVLHKFRRVSMVRVVTRNQ